MAETYDGWLNDINGMHVKPEHVREAIENAASGPVAEGCVGGGTGMICHEFKGGIGTSSRRSSAWRTAAGLLASWCKRTTAIGRCCVSTASRSASPFPIHSGARFSRRATKGPDAHRDGSIIIVVATDAPLLPHQLDRMAQRAGLGIARVGGGGSNSSGDIFLAFSTANAGRMTSYKSGRPDGTARRSTWCPDASITPLFWGAIEATEEAILNALVAADTMVGRDGITAHALPHDRLVEIMTKHGRGPDR